MKKLLCLLCVALFFCCCDGLDFGKSESGYLDYLPKKTQEGANTFGCYINGELAASKSRFQEKGVTLSMLRADNYVNGYWIIYPKSSDKNNADTIMRFRVLLKQAYLNIAYDSLHKDIFECRVNFQDRDNLDIFGSVTTTFNITRFDQSNHIMSGELDALDIPLYNNKDSVVHLRKIRFDIKYGSSF